MAIRIRALIATVLVVALTQIVAPSTSASASTNGKSAQKVVAIGAENQYADVISQIGGVYLETSSLLNNPNTDPHTFEASPNIAKVISQAKLIVQNGLGYDSFMNSLESANPDSARKVIDVQRLLNMPDSTPNPHLWYQPTTMGKVAAAVASALTSLDPNHGSYYRGNLATFDKSLLTLQSAIVKFKAKYANVGVAVTEPVADYLLTALGLKILTPFSFQLDIMSGVDPSPELMQTQNSFFAKHLVKVFAYNQQVISPTTVSLLALAKKEQIPVVGVYETMPTPGYKYQSWILAEINALSQALASGISTQKL
jgi:zinc/manganese transport system substrate-binding protein